MIPGLNKNLSYIVSVQKSCIFVTLNFSPSKFYLYGYFSLFRDFPWSQDSPEVHHWGGRGIHVNFEQILNNAEKYNISAFGRSVLLPINRSFWQLVSFRDLPGERDSQNSYP
jgi:hypothetical protein